MLVCLFIQVFGNKFIIEFFKFSSKVSTSSFFVTCMAVSFYTCIQLVLQWFIYFYWVLSLTRKKDYGVVLIIIVFFCLFGRLIGIDYYTTDVLITKLVNPFWFVSNADICQGKECIKILKSSLNMEKMQIFHGFVFEYCKTLYLGNRVLNKIKVNWIQSPHWFRLFQCNPFFCSVSMIRTV